MQAKYRHYIWDFDGTLFDSYPHITYTFCKMMEDAGRPVDPVEADYMLRLSFADARKHFAMPDEVYNVFRMRQREDFDPPVVPYPEIKSVLKALSDAGADHYIYTHRDTKSLLYYLDKYDLRACFAGMITSDDDFPLKPAPDALLALMERYGLQKEDCVMVGDREIDIGSGKAAGIAGCLFDERLLSPKTVADHTVTALSQIPLL